MAHSRQQAISFPDHNQNFWQLMSIQVASPGLLGLLVGAAIAAKYGIGQAIFSIVIGNLILWMIGLTIISMANPDRFNAIENVRSYLGKIGGAVAALFLILAFLSWYLLQIDSSIQALSIFLPVKDEKLRWGAAIGALTALLSMGGIVWIRRLSVISFPLIFGFIIYLALRALPTFYLESIWEFSLFGMISIIAVNLSGMVNLPTFFRHARSRGDAYLALSLMTFFIILFQLLSIVAGYGSIDAIKPENTLDAALWGAYIFYGLILVNLVNIYFASAGWEMIFPHRKSAIEYAIMGLIGTMAYTFLQISTPMEFLETMAQNFIASLGIVLMMAFLVRIVVRHRPRPFEKHVNVACWLFGGLVGTAMKIQNGYQPAEVFAISISASGVAFLVMVFAEETLWSVKKIFK